MNDRPILSPESVREVSNIVLDAVQIYADKFGFEVESCAVEIDPKYKVRILEGEKKQVRFYNNAEEHEVFGSIKYSKNLGLVTVDFYEES